MNISNKKNIYIKSFIIFITFFFIYACNSSEEGLLISENPQPTKYSKSALLIADYILEQQNREGAIPDERNGSKVNEDSNMEYCLIGLAAAYWYSKDSRYLNGLEKGIKWLAEREEMVDERWRGSWYYAYSFIPPYNHIPTSPGGNVDDVRGVDATSSLFIYLIYLHSSLTGKDDLVTKYEKNAKAGLDFVLKYNKSKDGFFINSWQLVNGNWRLYNFRYASDQGDVYLGLKAGVLLYKDKHYGDAASFLENMVSSAFFSENDQRYATGSYDDGSLKVDDEGFDIIFPQGYLPWIFGQNPENNIAFEWLKNCEQEDGSLSCFVNDPLYSLTVDIYALAAKSLNNSAPAKSLDWLIENNLDEFGGVRDNANPSSLIYSNIAGFSIAALLDFHPFF
jgi:hypothetical protein